MPWIDLFVTLGGELRDAAFRLAGSFTLAGIDHKEILGVRLQVFQVDPVILGFGLLVIRFSSFHGGKSSLLATS
jgi:hypothetical protein